MKKFLFSLLFILLIAYPLEAQAAKAYTSISRSGDEWDLDMKPTKIGKYYYTHNKSRNMIFRSKNNSINKMIKTNPILVDIVNATTDGSYIYYLRNSNLNYYLCKASLDGKHDEVITKIDSPDNTDFFWLNGMYKDKIYYTKGGDNPNYWCETGYMKLIKNSIKFHKIVYEGSICQSSAHYFVCYSDSQPSRIYSYNAKTDKEYFICKYGAFSNCNGGKIYYVDLLTSNAGGKFNIVKTNYKGSSKKIIKTIYPENNKALHAEDMTDKYVEYSMVSKVDGIYTEEYYRYYYKADRTIKINKKERRRVKNKVEN